MSKPAAEKNPTGFSILQLSGALLDNLGTLGYHTMTPIQARSLPSVLAGKDIIAQAKTGSGKTAAFGLGLLEKLDVKKFRVQSLVLCPTRELADQVARELRKLGRGIHNIKILTLCGGMPFGPQLGSLEHGAHIIVGTPGRVEEHLRKQSLKLETLTTLVLDEADRMLDMGFQTALDAIIEYLPGQRQNLLFSATYPKQIESIARRVMTEPVMVQVDEVHEEGNITQFFYPVQDDSHRMAALRALLLSSQPDSTLVFCTTKVETAEVARELESHGFSAVALHGDLEQKDRDQILVRFANKSVSVLVATDVAARGLDVEALDCVINLRIPRDLEVYTHRIGRTGRAGRQGFACAFYTPGERFKFEALAKHLQQELISSPLPAANLALKPARPNMVSLQIEGGKKQKLRPGDILGALTGENGVAAGEVGKITLFDNCAYVAVTREAAQTAERKISQGKLKGRSFRVRRL
ncbi:MAG: ATP-dependent RNA helicase DbpA [Pseudohongiellaceae bacterium]